VLNENASDSIQVNPELDSNEIDERDLQYEEHDDPSMPRFRGISSDEYEKPSDSIRVDREFDSNDHNEMISTLIPILCHSNCNLSANSRPSRSTILRAEKQNILN
jgi:hypothetical protein